MSARPDLVACRGGCGRTVPRLQTPDRLERTPGSYRIASTGVCQACSVVRQVAAERAAKGRRAA